MTGPERAGGPLAGLSLGTYGGGAAVGHAARLLASLGATVVHGQGPVECAGLDGLDAVLDGIGGFPASCGVLMRVEQGVEQGNAVRDWACSGAMALTGRRDGPALVGPGGPASAVRGALLAAELLARLGGRDTTLPGPEVLGERAALAGLCRDAPRSVGGAFRLVRAGDGWIGLNLARDSDLELLPAWVERPLPAGDPWPALAANLAGRDRAELTRRARLLGLPCAAVPERGTEDEQLAARGQQSEVWPLVLNGQVHRAIGSTQSARSGALGRGWRLPSMLVVDLSSLWAGPLCSHLLTLLGARVVKVESVERPDGARFGPGKFYDLLHAGQESVAVDFSTARGRANLAGLIEAADVVIEGSRPRALRQLGLDADTVLASGTDKCWVSITAYGRTGPYADCPGFGDDTAAAAGLVATDPATGTLAPCGDAIADPLAGVHAVLAVLACRLGGGRWLADVALREQAAATLTVAGTEPGPRDTPADVRPPTARAPQGRARPSGADTSRVLTELGCA